MNGTGSGSVDGRGVVPCTEDELHNNVPVERNSLTTQAPPAVEEGDLFGERPQPERKPKSPSKLTDAEIDPLFEVWWKPRVAKADKAPARRAFRAAMRKGVTVQTLTEGIEAYEAFCKKEKREDRFMKHQSSWINAEGWANERELCPVAKEPEGPDAEYEATMAEAYRLKQEQEAAFERNKAAYAQRSKGLQPT